MTMLTKKRLLWLTLALLLAVWLVMRACSMMNGVGPYYTFTVARDPLWNDVDLMGKDKNITGFTDDLLFSIAKSQNINLEVVQAPASILFDGLEYSEFDGVISTLMATPLMQEKFYFSNPYFLIGPVLIVPISSKVRSLEELGTRILGVKRDSHVVFDISQHAVSFAPYDSMAAAFEDLENNHIDGIVMPLLPAYTFTQLFYPGTLKIAAPPLTNEGLRVIAARSSEGKALVNYFDAGLEALKADGTYDAIIAKWGLINADKIGVFP